MLVDIASPQVNTSVPSVQRQGQIVKATRRGTMTIGVLDRTPGDEIEFEFVNNGSKNEYTLESGEQQVIELEEGKNTFTAYAHDLRATCRIRFRG